MKADEIRSLLEREPFRPFTIETVSGRSLAIAEADQVLLPPRKPELVIAFAEDGSMHLIELSAIQSLVTP